MLGKAFLLNREIIMFFFLFFYSAAGSGSIPRLMSYRLAGVDLNNKTDYSGRTPLHVVSIFCSF